LIPFFEKKVKRLAGVISRQTNKSDQSKGVAMTFMTRISGVSSCACPNGAQTHEGGGVPHE
jgi:hypothetical protein